MQGSQLATDGRDRDDHIVYINCSPDKKGSRQDVDNQYAVSKLVQTPYDSRKSYQTDRSVHSASRDKFSYNMNAAYNENNDSIQLDHQKKQPNTSSIIMVKQKSGLKTDRTLHTEPMVEKKETSTSGGKFGSSTVASWAIVGEMANMVARTER